MAMVQRPTDVTPGAPAGDARAAVVTGLSLRAAEHAIETQIETHAHLMSDEAKAFMAIGESFAKHETVKHSSNEYVRDTVHVNSVEGFNSRVRRTIAGVFHHISPQHADLYFHEIGFRWSQRVVSGAPFGKLGMAGKSCELSGHGCRQRCNCRLSFALPRDVRCAEVPMAASPSNRP
jgi:hypothetical protein